MATLEELLIDKREASKCAFMFIPPNKTKTGFSLIGRNYDYPSPFDRLAKYLVVTVINEPKKIPTAFISIAGEMYCPTCINAKGLFLEMNTGMLSGGYLTNMHAKSMLAATLEISKNAGSLEEMASKLRYAESDYSLLVNAADSQKVVSFEYSTNPDLGMKHYCPSNKKVFAVTNLFINPEWSTYRIPKPTDADTWFGASRRNGLLDLLTKERLIDVGKLKAIMDVPIQKGGGLWSLTIYQLIFDESNMDLYIRINDQSPNWQKIPLRSILNIH